VAKDQIQCQILLHLEQENIEIPFPHVQLKYDPATDNAVEVRAKKEEEKKAKEEKIKRQEEAREKEAEVQVKKMEARTATRKRAEEIRILLEDEELEEEVRESLLEELSSVGEKFNVSDDD